MFSADRRLAGGLRPIRPPPDAGRSRRACRRSCEREGIEDVPYEEVARGWESDDGRVVVLPDDGLAGLPLPGSPKAVGVLAFVPGDQVDPLLLNTPYYPGAADPTARARTHCCARPCARAAWRLSSAWRRAPASRWRSCG